MGLDSVEMIMEVEDEFDIHIEDEAAQQILTVGQMIDAVQSRLVPASYSVCRSAATFYHARRIIREGLGSPDLRLSPDDVLASVVPFMQRPYIWSKLQREGLVKQPLEQPGWVRFQWSVLSTFAITSSIAMVIMLPIPFGLPLAFLTFVFGMVITMVFGPPLAVNTPRHLATMRDLVNACTRFDRMQTRESIREIVFDLTVEQYGADRSKLNEQTRFVEDLGAD